MSDDIYAFSELEGAIRRTKDLLWPLNAGVWLRLAVIVFFVGAGGGFPNIFQYSGGDLPPGAGMPPGVPGYLLLAVGIVLLLALLYMLIGSIFQFVFVDCLTTGDISLSRFFRLRTGKGLRLFLFQIGLVILMFAALLAVLIPFVIALFGMNGVSGAMSVVLFLVLLPVVLILALIIGIIQIFTIDFVVPIMNHDDCGVIEGWRRLWHSLSCRKMQALAYLVTRFVVSILVGIATAIVVLIALAIIAIPFVIIGLLLYGMFMSNIAVLLVLLIPYLIIAIPVALLISVPFSTFLRYYPLQVLARLAPGYAMLP